MGTFEGDRFKRYRRSVRPKYKGPADGAYGQIPGWKKNIKKDRNPQTTVFGQDPFGKRHKPQSLRGKRRSQFGF